jgi:hypothetical protein
MTRAIFAVIAALVSLALEPAQAVAAEAPWCAVTKEGDHWDCSYRSVAECQSNVVAGNRGWCNQNPYFIAVPTKRRPTLR